MANKPAPDCYRLALEKLDLPADACLAVEDTEAGLKAAVGAGVACIAVPHGMSSHQDFSAALAVVQDVNAVVARVLAATRLMP